MVRWDGEGALGSGHCPSMNISSPVQSNPLLLASTSNKCFLLVAGKPHPGVMSCPIGKQLLVEAQEIAVNKIPFTSLQGFLPAEGSGGLSCPVSENRALSPSIAWMLVLGISVLLRAPAWLRDVGVPVHEWGPSNYIINKGQGMLTPLPWILPMVEIAAAGDL